jgi:hypothetical protein
VASESARRENVDPKLPYPDEAVFASGGNPYGTSVTADGSPLSEEDKAAIRHQTERLLEVAAKLKAAEPAADESRLVGASR